MATASARALRESFGDRNISISRKISCCVACRKLKIKCRKPDDGGPCPRCRSRGLSCTVNKSLQALLESDVSWKEGIERRLDTLEQGLQRPQHTAEDAPSDHDGNSLVRGNVVEANMTPMSLQTPDRATLNLSGSLGAFPASSMVDVTLAKDASISACRPDMISCGIVPLHSARTYFEFFVAQLNPCMHYILTKDTTLANVRARSALLVSSICTVASYCTGASDYQALLKAFMQEVSRKLFSDKYEFDDVRALCIAASWLSDMSSALNGLAVRIGTQLDLHRCITKMPHTKLACCERTRLYFLVYLCDHNCSLIFGRPPMTTEFRNLKGPGTFLQSEFSTSTDLDLISEVEFWSLNRRVFDLFGSDIQSTIVSQRLVELERLSDAFDQWYQDWHGILRIEEDVASKRRRTFEFHYHSAKLYLFSHIFRGPSQDGPPVMLQGTDHLAIKASEHALLILRNAVDGDDNDDWLITLPHYFGTMIAFASVCLIRTTLQDTSAATPKATETLHYLRRISEIIRASSIGGHAAHPLTSIARSLDSAISERSPQTTTLPDQGIADDFPHLTFDFDMFASDPLNLTFPGSEDHWWLCPDDQLPEMVL